MSASFLSPLTIRTAVSSNIGSVTFTADVLMNRTCFEIMNRPSGMQMSVPTENVMPDEFIFKNEEQSVINCILSCGGLVLDVAKVIASYVVSDESYFGAEEWRKHYGVDVGDTPPLSEECRTFWRSRDPIDPTKRVHETHLPPVLRPRIITHISTHRVFGFNLEILGKLVKMPLVGHRSNFSFTEKSWDSEYPADLLEVPPAPAYWLVMRKEGCARNRGEANPFTATLSQFVFMKSLNQRIQADYEDNPLAIDISTVVFTRYLRTSERYLGDETGMEKQKTYVAFKSQNEVYGLGKMLGGFSPSQGLTIIDQPEKASEITVVAIKKF